MWPCSACSVGNVLDDAEKVDIAVEVEASDGEGAMQVCAYEIRAETA
jgi:hypothetical protein